MFKQISIFLVFLGVLLILLVTAPILFSQLRLSFTPPPLIDPTATEPAGKLIIKLSGINSLDYTVAQNWFTSPLPQSEARQSPVQYFTVSIPRLNLADVSVEVNGENLAKGPIHFPGTALPGEFGNPVIFGHSSLPELFKSSNPLTAFNSLPKIKIGDEIYINYDGANYKYVVRSTKEVKPTELDSLAQLYDKKQITLITCVPLGTYWRRFVATAELVQ